MLSCASLFASSGVWVSRIKNNEEATEESTPVKTAAAEKKEGGDQTAAGLAAFQGGIGSGAHKQPVRHFFLRDT